MAELFATSKQTTSHHIINILKEKELLETAVVKQYLTTAADGKNYNVVFQGRVICKFDIDEDGTVSDIRVTKSAHPLLDSAAVHVISIMPKWNPMKTNGETNEMTYTLPITFRLENDTDSTKTNNK